MPPAQLPTCHVPEMHSPITYRSNQCPLNSESLFVIGTLGSDHELTVRYSISSRRSVHQIFESLYQRSAAPFGQSHGMFSVRI